MTDVAEKPRCEVSIWNRSIDRLLGLTVMALNSVGQRSNATEMLARLYRCCNYQYAMSVAEEYVQVIYKKPKITV